MHLANYENGVISTAHPLASEAGVNILKRGGNVVDAIIASAATLSATLPPFSGLAGGGFLIVYFAKSGKTFTLDYRETAPLNFTSDMFRLDNQGNVLNDRNAMGGLSVAVPGTVAGYETALKRFGNLSFSEVLQPAIQVAKLGLTVTKTMKKATIGHLNKIRCFPTASRIYLANNNPREINEKILIPGLEKTYSDIASEGKDAFYNGEIGKDIVKAVQDYDGVLSEEDLLRYEPVLREPIKSSYHEYEIITMPPPSVGGIQLIRVLHLLEEIDLNNLGHNSKDYLALLAKTLAQSFDERTSYASDPDFNIIPVENLISKSASSFSKASAGYKGRGTTHMSAIDNEGNFAALSESIECFYGSGIVAPRSGLLLNDTMHDFDPRPNKLNSVAPRKRPVSSMTPSIVLKEGTPILALGSAAGPRIVSAVIQSLLNVLVFKMSIKEAVSSPRIHCQGKTIILESRISEYVQTELRKLGFILDVKAEYELSLGGVQAVARTSSGGFVGAADPRRDGEAVGY